MALINSFDAIYQAALRQDPDALRAATIENSIDEYQQGTLYVTASARLAAQNNIPAYRFLMAHGANINYVAFGAALGGHQKAADTLLKEGATYKFVAMGAASGGYRKYANEVLKRSVAFFKNPPHALINAVALCAAIGGHEEYANELLARGADIGEIAMGAGIGDHRAYAEKLITQGAMIGAVGMGVAWRGDTVYLSELFSRSPIKDILLPFLAQGAATGGNDQCVKHIQLLLLERLAGARAELASDPLTQSISPEKIEESLQIEYEKIQCKIMSKVAFGAAEAGHHAYTNTLLRQSDDKLDICNIIKSATYYYHKKYASILILRYLATFLSHQEIEKSRDVFKTVGADSIAPEQQNRIISMAKNALSLRRWIFAELALIRPVSEIFPVLPVEQACFIVSREQIGTLVLLASFMRHDEKSIADTKHPFRRTNITSFARWFSIFSFALGLEIPQLKAIGNFAAKVMKPSLFGLASPVVSASATGVTQQERCSIQ